jgi:hypothetical protein
MARPFPPWTGNPLPPWGTCSRTGLPHVGGIILCGSCGARRPYPMFVAEPRRPGQDARENAA